MLTRSRPRALTSRVGTKFSNLQEMSNLWQYIMARVMFSGSAWKTGYKLCDCLLLRKLKEMKLGAYRSVDIPRMLFTHPHSWE